MAGGLRLPEPTVLAVNLLFAGLLWLVLEGLENLIYPLIRGSVLHLEPPRSARVLMALALLPAVLSLSLTVLVATPALQPWLITAHCHPNIGCGYHSPAALAPPALAVLGLLSFLLLALQVDRRIRTVREHAQVLRRLGRHAQSPIAERPYGLIDHPQPLAFTTGLLRPQVWLTQGLVGRLGDEALAIVLAHEIAHQRRRDPLRHLVAGLARIWPRPCVLLSDLYQASEHVADRSAAHLHGHRRVAETLIQVQRLAQGPCSSASTAFADGDLQDRIHRLLLPPAQPAPMGARLVLFVLLLVGTVFLCIEPLHHLSEWLMGVP